MNIETFSPNFRYRYLILNSDHNLLMEKIQNNNQFYGEFELKQLANGYLMISFKNRIENFYIPGLRTMKLISEFRNLIPEFKMGNVESWGPIITSKSFTIGMFNFYFDQYMIINGQKVFETGINFTDKNLFYIYHCKLDNTHEFMEILVIGERLQLFSCEVIDNKTFIHRSHDVKNINNKNVFISGDNEITIQIFNNNFDIINYIQLKVTNGIYKNYEFYKPIILQNSDDLIEYQVDNKIIGFMKKKLEFYTRIDSNRINFFLENK